MWRGVCQTSSVGCRPAAVRGSSYYIIALSRGTEIVTRVAGCLSDVVSRLSARCCERIVAWNAVSVLFRLVRSCNRSLPHMEIINYTVNVLLNLAKVGPPSPLPSPLPSGTHFKFFSLISCREEIFSCGWIQW